MADPLTVGTVISVAAGSSVLGAGLTQAMTWIKDSRSGKRDATYLALRLAIILERFADDAADVAGNISAFKSRDQEEGVATGLPMLQELPGNDERWRDLDPMLATRVLEFEHLRRSRQGSIDSMWEHGDADEAIDGAHNYAIALGYHALRLASKLRTKYKLPELDSNLYLPEFIRDQYEALPRAYWNVGSDLE